jgi:hypothetical protein
VDEGEDQQHARNDEDVQRKEARYGGSADDGSTEQQMDERRADERYAAHDGGSDAEAPVGVLIEAHDLSGKGHAEREQEKEDADDPGEFAREFVCAEEEDLHHVDEHDGDHEVRTPAVQRAQIPAERNSVVENAEAGPGFVGRGAVDEGEQDAGDNLHQEQDRGGAAEDIHPAGVVRGCGMGGRVGERLDEAQAVLEPLVGGDGALFHAGHSDLAEVDADGSIWMSGFGLEQEACVASVGMSPAWIMSESPVSW